MGQYIFRFPVGLPALTYEALNAYVLASPKGRAYARRDIGTTVMVDLGAGCVRLKLYAYTVATIYPDRVQFSETDDAHMSTTAWIGKIIRDNRLGGGSTAWRIRRHASDGEGPCVPRGHAGLLAIDGNRDQPVFGHTYPTGRTAP